MYVFKGIIILSLSVSLCHADNNQTIQDESSYIDDIHKSLSQTVLEWADIIDTKLSNWLGDEENNTVDVEGNITILETNITDVEDNTSIVESNITDIEDNTTIIESNTTAVKTNRTIVPIHTKAVKTNRTIVPDHTTVVATDAPEHTLEEEVKAVDQFFQNEKYLDETDETFIRVRVASYFQSKESSDFDFKIRAQMPFSKSKKRFKIFVNDLTLENADNILQDTSKTPDIGVHYFASRSKIKSRYSVGLSGIDPFVKARYNMLIRANEWLIDTVQLFEYSTDDKFEEETNIYFDRSWSKKSLVRIQLHRSTHEETDGMDYLLSAQYFRATKKDAGYGFAQSFVGNTKYKYIVDNSVGLPETETFGGINTYVTSFSWRENIWRKWFYYEIRPSVAFERQYDYEPNYRVRIFLDFYFGKFN